MQLRGADVDTIIGRALVFGDVNRNRKNSGCISVGRFPDLVTVNQLLRNWHSGVITEVRKFESCTPLDQEAAGSSPVTQTKFLESVEVQVSFFRLFCCNAPVAQWIEH